MNTMYLSGGKFPEIIHQFNNFPELKNHFVQLSEQSVYPENFYLIPLQGENILKKVGELNSIDDLKDFYISGITSLQASLSNVFTEMDNSTDFTFNQEEK